jgi:hypothetical protein
LIAAGGWAAAACAIAELWAREVARRSLVGSVTEFTPGVIAFLVAIAAVLSAAALLRRGTLLFAALFAIGLAAQIQLGARLQSDGFYYYAYLRSLAFDRDFNFTNDYTLLGLQDHPQLFQPTRTKHAQSAASIGPAILWSPFFAAGHLVARSVHARHPEIDVNGISFPYRQSVCVAGLFYGLVGCWLSFAITKRYFDGRVAALAVAAVIAGSFMLWYLVTEPSMTHAPSMMAVAAFMWIWLSVRERVFNAATARPAMLRDWATLGIAAGLMTLIRWQNALFAVLPLCDVLVVLARRGRADIAEPRPGSAGLPWPEPRRRQPGPDIAAPPPLDIIIGGLVFTAAAALAFIPQMVAWHSIYGSWLAVSPLGPQIRWAHPQIVDILWSSRNGLLSWSPVLYLAAIGLVMFAVAFPSVGVPSLVAVAIMTYFNSTIQDWWGSDGFGGRRFDGIIPMLCLGAASFITYAAAVTRRHPLRALAAGAGVLVIWNLTLMSAAHDGAFRIGTTVSYGDTFAAQGRAFHRWFGNPFSYPASLLFALRNRVPPASYDLLRTNRFLADPLRPYGRIDIGSDDGWLLEDGWHGPEHEGSVTFRWAASPAQVIVPLDRSAALTVQVRMHSFAFPSAPPQTLTIAVNGHSFGPVAVHETWDTLEFATDADAWRGGVNRLRLEFAWARSPADVGLSGDARPLSAAVDYIRVAQRD